LERQLGDPGVILNSFIVSSTPFNEIPWSRDMKREVVEARNILFQQEDRANYIRKLLEKCLQGNTESAT